MARAKLTAEQREKASEQSIAYYYRNRELVCARNRENSTKHKVKRAEYSKIYALANAEKIKERQRLYRIANKERTAALYQANKEERLKKMADYYAANADAVRSRVRNYSKANPEKVALLSRKKRAVKLGATVDISNDIVDKLMKSQKGLCVCCKTKLASGSRHLDHIEPLSKGGAHSDFNVQLLCPTCNMSKGVRNPIDFMQSRGFLL